MENIRMKMVQDCSNVIETVRCMINENRVAYKRELVPVIEDMPAVFTFERYVKVQGVEDSHMTGTYVVSEFTGIPAFVPRISKMELYTISLTTNYQVRLVSVYELMIWYSRNYRTIRRMLDNLEIGNDE